MHRSLFLLAHVRTGGSGGDVLFQDPEDLAVRLEYDDLALTPVRRLNH